MIIAEYNYIIPGCIIGKLSSYGRRNLKPHTREIELVID